MNNEDTTILSRRKHGDIAINCDTIEDVLEVQPHKIVTLNIHPWERTMIQRVEAATATSRVRPVVEQRSRHVVVPKDSLVSLDPKSPTWLI